MALLLALWAAFPVSRFKGMAERQLSTQLGAPVRIGSLGRESPFSLHPVIRATGVRVAQPGWAGSGDMATIDLLRLRMDALKLLVGRLDADLLEVRGARLDLLRAEDGRENWRGPDRHRGAASRAGMEGVLVSDMHVRYEDRLQKRRFDADLRIDPAVGLTLSGSGAIDGAPVSIAGRGGPMASGRPWPFDFALSGPAIAMHAVGTMAKPLDTEAMDFRITARADDLKRIDRVIEAGLFGTQPVDLRAQVRHEAPVWTISSLTGTIGRSALTGRLTARKDRDRTKLDGEVRFSQLDFDDLASDEGKARALARERAEGPKLVPELRVNIRKIDQTDGRIAVRADRILAGRRPSAIANADAVLTLDDRILTIAPLTIGLTRGTITGRAVVDQRAGQPKPHVTLALMLNDSRISALAGGGDGEIEARVDGRADLRGTGDTIREAVGAANGSIGVAARSGSLPSRIAALIGFDIGKGLIGGDDGRAALRCAVVRLQMNGGRGMADPLLIDTGVSQSRGSGTVEFPAERLDLAFRGTPKGNAALRLPGAVFLRGTIRDPHLVVPQENRTVGTVLKALGRAIAGHNPPPAPDADCPALIARALG